MNRRSYLRLSLGLVFIFLGIGIAAKDVMKDMWHDYIFSPREQVQDSPVSDPYKASEDPALCTDQEPCEADETLQILKGDTLASVLKRAGIEDAQIAEILERFQKVFNPKDLRPDHELYMTYLPFKDDPQKRDLLALHLRPSLEYEIHIEKNEEGIFIGRREEKNLTHDTKVAKGVIENSLFIDAAQKGVPHKVLHEMMQVFIHMIDFQRDFHPGDHFGVVYHTAYDPVSLREKAGDMLYAVLILGGKEYRIYRYKHKNGTIGYFNERGESVKKGLLRTPIDGARISSLFGTRRHPISGYTKMHKGVDFAAPTGTPIMASGDGVIEKIGPYGNYGNYVRIRHNQEYSTAYAHLSRFGKNLKAGTRVRQGQIIGFVGSTGQSTGPHLHYELIRFNQQINPKKVTSLPAAKLAGADLKLFMNRCSQVNGIYERYEDPPLREAVLDDSKADSDEEDTDTTVAPSSDQERT
jgi:murein DD-endopeptidase MepM/ murein hydrolase activator NlpD